MHVVIATTFVEGRCVLIVSAFDIGKKNVQSFRSALSAKCRFCYFHIVHPKLTTNLDGAVATRHLLF